MGKRSRVIAGPLMVQRTVPDLTPLRGWTPDRLLQGLLIWTSFTTIMFWLPAIRSLFDGSSYTWGIAGFGGAGLRGDIWFPLAGVVFAIVFQVLGWRGARSPFHILLVGWHLLLFAGVIYAVRSDSESFRFQGDSLGIDVSLGFVGPFLFGIPAVFGVAWAWKDLRTHMKPSLTPWGRRNSRWLLGLLFLLPVQFVLLHFGPPESTADAVGVVMTILQWMLIGQALRPSPSGAGSQPQEASHA